MADAEGYLHGYHTAEQDRLYAQARFLEPCVFEGFDLSGCAHILEVGCGVGAQTEILLRRFPRSRGTGVDLSLQQLERAREHFAARDTGQGRWQFLEADASRLDGMQAEGFDGAYFCWVLEHVPDPLAILKSVRRALQPGSLVCLAEVFNHSLHTTPPCPRLNAYWRAYNELPTSLGGDPDVGVKLGDLLHLAGFQDIKTWPQPLHFDRRRHAERDAMLEYWTRLLLSGAPALLDSHRVSPDDVTELRGVLARMRASEETVFFYNFMKATARA